MISKNNPGCVNRTHVYGATIRYSAIELSPGLCCVNRTHVAGWIGT